MNEQKHTIKNDYLSIRINQNKKQQVIEIAQKKISSISYILTAFIEFYILCEGECILTSKNGNENIEF